MWFSSDWCLKFVELLASPKSSFSIFLLLEGLNKIEKKIKNHSKPSKLLIQSLFKKFQKIPNIFSIFYWNFNPFAPCHPLAGWYHRFNFGQQYLKKQRRKYDIYRRFLKEYSLRFLMVCRLMKFELAAVKLLIFKACAIIGISKIMFFTSCLYKSKSKG